MEAHARSRHVMFRHPVSGRPVILGGDRDGVIVPDALEWNGFRFSKISPDVGAYQTPMPVNRTRSAVATLPDGRVFLFGGEYASNALVDLWELDLAGVWHRRPMQGDEWPVGRRGHAMSYDPATGKVLLFGGQDGAGAPLNDNWLLDPETCTWESLSPASKPGTRWEATMCVFDGAIHLFGGNKPAPQGGFYRWDGITWTSIGAASPPANRGGHVMLALGSDLLVLGGPVGADSAHVYDGTAWAAAVDVPTTARNWSASFSDERGAIICSGRHDADSTFLEDVWEYDTSWSSKDVQLATEPADQRAALLAWNAEAGISQLQVSEDVVLGSATPTTRKLKVGDKVRLQQVGVTGVPILGITGTFSCPQPPADTAWKVSLLVDEVECGSRVFARARKNVNVSDLVVNADRVKGVSCTFAVQLELIAI